MCKRFEEETFYISFHFSTLVMGSIDKGCMKEQMDYWVLDWIAHLCVAGYSMVCSLFSSYMFPEIIACQAYSISEGHCTYYVSAF